MSIIGESPLDQERATVAAIQRLRRRAEQFRQLAAMAVTKKAAAILLETSRGYAEQAAYWEAKLITSRPVL